MPARSKSSPGRRRAAPPTPRPCARRSCASSPRKAKRAGIRAVLMGELATELRMSAMTLYKHFASKDELVVAMVDAWARRDRGDRGARVGEGRELRLRARGAARLGGRVDGEPLAR